MNIEMVVGENVQYYIGCDCDINSINKRDGLSIEELHSIGMDFCVARFGLPDIRVCHNNIENLTVYYSHSIDDLLFDYVSINRDYNSLSDVVIVRMNEDFTYDIIPSNIIAELIDSDIGAFDFIIDALLCIDAKIDELIEEIKDGLE